MNHQTPIVAVAPAEAAAMPADVRRSPALAHTAVLAA